MKLKLNVALFGIFCCFLSGGFLFQKQLLALFPPSSSPEVLQLRAEQISTRPAIMEDQLVNSQTQFGFKLLQELFSQNDHQNTFISPTSIALALSMLYNGAEGVTQQEIASTLEYQGLSLEEINHSSQVLQQLLNDTDSEITLAVANSLWAREEFEIKSQFLETNKQVYQAEVAKLDFNNPNASQTINNWVDNKTNGKITRIVGQLQPSDILFLINAIYFKGQWTTQFDAAKTQEKPFYLLGGQVKQHPLMSHRAKYPYLETEQFQAISLTYGEEKRFSFYVFLPHQETNIEAFIQTLTTENWNEWMTQFRSREGSIELPRFRIEYEAQLNDILKKLGMKTSFDSNQANFSNISSQPLVVSSVQHKTFVEVNEEGTEAAAVTSIGMRTTSIPEPPFQMSVNRPFFCAIRDNQTGTLLFVGTILNPS